MTDLITLNQPLPRGDDIRLAYLGADGTRQALDLSTLTTGRKLIRFMPGAFTPTCTGTDLPSLARDLDGLVPHGVKCFLVSGSNPHTMHQWIEMNGLSDRITGLSDIGLKFTEACGLMIDLTEANLGLCPQRAAIYAKDGIVRALAVEEAPGKTDVCTGSTWLQRVINAIQAEAGPGRERTNRTN